MSVKTSTALIVKSHGRTLLEEYGPWHSPGTPVLCGSLAKVALTAALHAANANKEIDFDEPVASTLDVNLPSTVTVRSLLTHKSGLPRMIPGWRKHSDDPYKDWTESKFRTEALPLLGRWAKPPGNYEYSNLGFAVLGCFVKDRFNLDWWDFTTSRLSLPASTGDCRSPAPANPRPTNDIEVAQARSLRGRPLPDWQVPASAFAPAGGLAMMLRALADMFEAMTQSGKPVPPSDPQLWDTLTSEPVIYSGATLRNGCVAALAPQKGSVTIAHCLGGIPGGGANAAVRAINGPAVRRAISNLLDNGPTV
jgi:D-alanyl-D-alanine-carboxypeptidase/D-alanyl-D-alanine-endopeptidase